jgi:AcrR family transcriptional regulator
MVNVIHYLIERGQDLLTCGRKAVMMNVVAERRSHVRLPREQRMRQIEAAARDVFSRHGFNDASVSEIAGQAGISEGAIYKFYANKRELLHTILTDWYRGMIAEFLAKLEGTVGTRTRMRLVIWQHLKSIRENPDLCRLFFSEVRSAPDYYDSALHMVNREYTRVLIDILKAGVEAGDIRDDVSPSLVRDVIFGGVEHHVSSYVAGRGEFDHDFVADRLSEMVFAGIAADHQTPKEVNSIIDRLEHIADRMDNSGSGLSVNSVT